MAAGGFAIGVVILDDFLTRIHEDAVIDLHAGVVTELRSSPAACWLTDEGHVVERNGGHWLGIGLLRAVNLNGTVAETRARSGARNAVAGNDQAELSLTAPSLVEIERIVADVPDAEVLEVDLSAPNFNAVVDVVHDLNVINDGVLTDATERKAVQFITKANHLAAVAERNEAKHTAVVLVIAATVEGAGVAGAGSNQAFHVGIVASIWGRRVGGNGAVAVLTDVCVTTDGEVAPLVGNRAPLTAWVGWGPSQIVNLGSEDDRTVGRTAAGQAGIPGDSE